MTSAAACAERATSDKLIGPDWAINLELCDILNMDPGQTKEALKVLKKRLGSKSPNVQLLTLSVLETLSKNCGDTVHQQIVERDILHEMVKIVKKKPALNVREKILVLIDTWQDAFGESGGRHPQYHAAYQELRAAGVEFPPRIENVVPLFTPPQTHPVVHQPSAYETALEASLQSEVSSLSLQDIQNARGIADVLSEMLNALDPKNQEGIKQEAIVDLVEQCNSYKKRVMVLANNTRDEELLCQGLTLNDELERVLQRHDDIIKGTSPSGVPPVASSLPFINVNHEDDELEDDFSLQLSLRGPRYNATGNGSSKPPSTLLHPPPPIGKEDYLSGDAYRSEQSFGAPVNPPLQPTSPLLKSSDPAPFLESSRLPRYDEPVQAERSTVELPKAPWESQTLGPLPPSVLDYSQREQGFDPPQKHGSSGGVPITHYQNPSFTHDASSLDPHHNQRSFRSQDVAPTTSQTKPEDALFKDLVDFAKAKSSSSPKAPNTLGTR
ncbi:TOM1-like protein 3 [Zingiber officinale]|uniref:TOM1-like protein 3 n=1 Tax=Zingiber officinale TaxID=94328 RepID=UPI001C4ABEC6|nr:TOM1-like protein 3 [Zingiber officinale]XP_042448654.1 TOM1-like protein 3 [Zingiber officinale]XP_042448655.1 TOM1-like protein 3 [Zingiber officinale]XP_042448656.1 TOM1-like protein 3 [Zingiber officinale]XP_042448657.1 TOM1-like protein 3 [Zingiber officinale]